jgi:phage tail tape-measure protein
MWLREVVAEAVGLGSSTANDSTSVCSCVASVRPGVKGTSRRGRPSSPPSRPRAAAEHDQVGQRDLLAAGLRALKSSGSFSSTAAPSPASAGSLTSQSFCGARRMRAPLAPPRLSLSRKVEAEAHAVETSWEIDRPEARILP